MGGSKLISPDFEDDDDQRMSEVERKSLDEKLEERGIVPVVSRDMVQRGKYSKDFIMELRRAKEYSMRKIKGTPIVETSYDSISRSIETVTGLNRKIEAEIKYEIMNKEKNPLKKSLYVLGNLFSKKERMGAEKVLIDQQENIEGVLGLLKGASERLDKKVGNLEFYSRSVLNHMAKKHLSSNDKEFEIQEVVRLWSESKKALESVDDYSEKVKYWGALKEMEREIEKKGYGMKLDKKAEHLLKKILPKIYSVESISRAYSFALKETEQEGGILLNQLDHLWGVYLEVARADRSWGKLENEVHKLYQCTDNLQNIFKQGAVDTVKKANESLVFGNGYQQSQLSIDRVLGEIENSNSRTLLNLEKEITGYLT